MQKENQTINYGKDSDENHAVYRNQTVSNVKSEIDRLIGTWHGRIVVTWSWQCSEWWILATI